MPQTDLPKEQKGIAFHQLELVPELQDLSVVTQWLYRICRQEMHRVRSLSYVFVDDPALLEMNQQYLDHDTLTDIITFPYSSRPIEGEVYISIDRVRENAAKYGVDVFIELLRVIAHGALHLCGWEDKTSAQRSRMHKRENACLALYGFGGKFSGDSPS